MLPCFDKVWVAVIPLLTFSNFVIMEFVAVRFNGCYAFLVNFVGIFMFITAVFMFVAAAPFALRAMAITKFFEWKHVFKMIKSICLHIWSIQDCEASYFV